jgi:hypothetical protein
MDYVFRQRAKQSKQAETVKVESGMWGRRMMEENRSTQ